MTRVRTTRCCWWTGCFLFPAWLFLLSLLKEHLKNFQRGSGETRWEAPEWWCMRGSAFYFQMASKGFECKLLWRRDSRFCEGNVWGGFQLAELTQLKGSFNPSSSRISLLVFLLPRPWIFAVIFRPYLYLRLQQTAFHWNSHDDPGVFSSLVRRKKNVLFSFACRILHVHGGLRSCASLCAERTQSLQSCWAAQTEFSWSLFEGLLQVVCKCFFTGQQILTLWLGLSSRFRAEKKCCQYLNKCCSFYSDKSDYFLLFYSLACCIDQVHLIPLFVSFYLLRKSDYEIIF